MFNLGLVVIETDATARKDEKPAWVDAMNFVIIVLFVIELSLRLCVLRFSFWLDGFNVLDFVIVSLDFILSALCLVAEKSLPEFIVQLARLSKIARTAKAFRVFPELRMWMSRLLFAFRSTFWRAMPLVFLLLAWSIVAVQFINPLNQEVTAKGEYDGCERCPQAYASIYNAFITFCQQLAITDGWGPSIKPVIDQFPMTLVFYASVFISVAMAIVNMIVGLVGDVASGLQDQLRDNRDRFESEQLSELMEVHANLFELRRLIGRGDRGADVRSGRTANEFATFCAELDMPEEELAYLWAVLDVDNSGKQQAPRAFMAESLALDWGLQQAIEFADNLPLFG